jgi:hypothetical protein
VQNSGSDPGQEWLDTEDADDPLQIIGQNVQAHLSRGGLEASRQEVSSPMQRLSVPKTCSTVHLRICMASGLCRSRSSMVSSTASCSQRLMRRSLPVVHCALNAQPEHRVVQ